MNPLVSILLIHPIPENKFIIPIVSLPIIKLNFFYQYNKGGMRMSKDVTKLAH